MCLSEREPRMPERQRERDPNRHQPEQRAASNLPGYHRTARYPDEQSSEDPYDQAQKTIYENPCDLSAYRFFRIDRDQGSHIGGICISPQKGALYEIE